MGETGGTLENPADDEQKIGEGEDDEEPVDDNGTTVIETPVIETPEENSVEEPTEDEVVDPTIDPEVETSDADEELSLDSFSPNAMEIAEDVKVSAFQVVPGEENKVSYEALADTTATITYMENTVDDDGTVNKESEKILFKVTPAEGKVLTKVQFAAVAKEEDLTATPSLSDATGSIAANMQYEISKKVADLIKDKNFVGIYITTREAKYTVKFAAGSNASDAKAYLKNSEGKYVFTGSNATSAAVEYSDRDSLTFAVTGLGEKADDAKVTMQKGSGSAVPVTGGTAGTEGEVKYLEYTLKLSDISGLSDGDTVTVTLDKTKAATIALAAGDLEVDTNVTVGTPDASLTAYKDHKELKADSYTAGDKIAFTATPKGNYKVTAPVAYWTTDEDETENSLTVTPKEETVGANKVTVYEIDLAGITQDVDLHVTIDAELDTEKEDVKTVSFSSETGHVKVIGATPNKDLIGKNDKFETAGNYTFKVEPDDGYAVTKLEAVFTKVYSDKTTKNESYAIGLDGAPLPKDGEIDPFNGETSVTALFSDSEPVEGQSPKAWTTKMVEIKITTEVETSVLDAEVTFASEGSYTADKTKGAYAFEVKTEEGKVEQKKNDDGEAVKNAYTVKAGTEYLEFTVTDAESDPVVTVNDDAKIAEKDGFTYRVPAVSLAKYTTVSITRQSKAVRVNYNEAGSIVTTVTDMDSEYSAPTTPVDKVTGYDSQNAYTVNADANIKIVGKMADGKKAQIQKVTYRIGDEGAEQEAAVKRDGTFEIKTAAAENIHVYVTKNTDKKVELTNVEYEIEDNVYRVKNYLTTINAKVYSGDTALSLFSASVKEGGKNAATKAVINKDDNTLATITVDKREFNQVLTVTLTTLDDRTPVTFQIKTDTPVTSVKYGNEEIKDGKLTLPVDTVLTTNVEMTAVNAPISNLGAAVIGVADTEIKDIKTTDGQNVAAEFNDGVLTITTLPSANTDGAGKENAAKIVLYDKKNENKIVEGSAITLSTDKAVVKKEGVVPNAKLSETNASSANSLRVEIAPVENLGKMPNIGNLYYKVEVDASNVTTANADVKNAITTWVDRLEKYYPMAKLDAEGGITLQVIPDKVKDEECVGAKADGFGVKVTLVQTINGASATDANTIVGGSKNLGPASTKDPYFEDTKTGKLKLKSGTTTLNTGDTRWISVAEPQFDKNADYTDVDVTFVDMKTGKERAPYGLEKSYNAVTNKVVVRFASKSGYYYTENEKSDTEYKDLGVKVTAKTKSTGYGVSGTVKLSVVNGIENISADAQPYVLKESSPRPKAATLKVAVDLNSSNSTKEYAPKKKNVTYEIVSAKTELNGNTEADLMNKAPAKAAADITLSNGKTVKGVDVKNNGTVTVAKEYELAKRAEDNQFKVLVKAADYEGNTVVGLTDVIEITGQNRALGKLTIVRIVDQWDNYGHRTILGGEPVNGNALEARKTDMAEYRAVLLKDGAELNNKGYYLFNNTNIVNPDEVNFTPAKGGVYVDAQGYIHVTKLGKAAIEATDKSDKRNKTEKLNLEFKQTSDSMILEIVQMKDSTLENREKEFYDTTVNFTGNNVTYFGVNVVDSEWHDQIQLSDVKLSFKNVKNVTPKKSTDWRDEQERFQYVIATTGKTGTITFQSRLQGKKDYTLTNDLTIDKNKKAPKLTLRKGTKIVAEDGQLLNYTVSGAKTDNFEGKYVMLSVDDTKKNPKDIRDVFNYDGQRYIDRALPIRSGSMLDIGMYAPEAGSYNLIAAVGTLENGVFTQEYADARLTVKVAKKGAVNLKVTGSYTLDPQVASTVKIQYNEKDGYARFANDPDADGNYAMNAIIDHKENKFNYYFEAKEDPDWYEGSKVLGTIGLKSTLTKEEVDALVADTKSPDLTGFISVYNAGKQMDVKITIKFKSFAKSVKAVATPVLAGDDVTVDIKLYNGKEYVPVKDYTLTVADSFAKAGLVNGPTNDKGEVLYGDIRLTGKKVTDGKKNLTIMATPANNTVYKENKQAEPVEVKVTLTVAKANLKNKAVITKGLDKWIVTSKDYVGPTEAHAEGAWKNDAITYSFKNRLSIKEGTKIGVAWDTEKFPYVSLASDDYSVENNLQTLTAELDKAELVKAVDGKKLKWGGKITVSATLSYAGTAEDEKYDPALEKDTVKLTITLPKTQPAASKTEADFQKLETSIQNMVETMSAYYQKVGYWDYAGCNEAIRSRIESIILEEADGATVDVSVDYTAANKGKEPEYQASKYTVIVKDIYTHDFENKPEMTVDSVWSKINALYGTNWAPAKANAAVKDLFNLNETTSTADYAAMIRNMLLVTGGLDNNIAISVALNTDVDGEKDGVKAPTTKAPGYYNVYVTLTDKSVAPIEIWDGEGRKHSRRESVVYTINAIETASAIETRVATELGKDDFISDVIEKAWDDVAVAGTDITTTEVQKALEAKVAELILAEADKMLKADTASSTANKNLTVKGFKEDEATEKTVALTFGTDSVTGISYTLVLSDSTEGAAKKEIEITVNQSGLTAPGNFQTLAELKTAAEKINLIPKAEDETAVKEAVANKIVALKKNPAIDLSKMKVTVVEGSFTVPAGNVDGLVSVTVKFDKDDEDETATEINNIVILASGDDFVVEDPDDSKTEEEIAAEKEIMRVKSAITAKLSAATLKKMIVDMKGGTIDESGVKTEIAKLVDEVLSDEYATPAETDITFAAGTTFEAPKDSSTEYTIPAFTVTFKKTGDTGNGQTVEIAEQNLGKLAEFQTIEEAKDALTEWAKTPLNLNHIVGLTASDATDISQGFTSLESLKTAVKEAVDEAGIIVEGFTVTTDAETADESHKTVYNAGTGDFEFAVTNWKVSVTDGSKTESEYVNVNIRKADKTPAVTRIIFEKVDSTEIKYNTDKTAIEGNGTSGTPVPIEVSGNKEKVTIALKPIEVTDAATDPKYQEVEWNATLGDGSKLDEDITMADGTLNIPLAAAGTSAADRTKTIKVVATSKENGLNGAKVKSAELYIKLTFVPEVTGLTIEGSGFIELNSDGNSGDVVYTATMTGNHLLATDKTTMLDWTTEGLGKAEGVTVAEETVGNASEVKVTLTNAAALKGKQNLVVSTLNGDGKLPGKATTKKKEITVRQSTDMKLGIQLEKADGVTLGTLQSNPKTQKITVTGGGVKIPLTITGDSDDVTRTWTFTKSGADVAAVEGITIIQADAKKKTQAMLVIDNTVPAMEDEVVDKDGNATTPAKTITLTANAAATDDGAGTAVKTTLTAALVIEKDVSGVKLIKTDNDGNAVVGDKGTTNVEVELAYGDDTTVVLATQFGGKHITASEEYSKVTYKISRQTRNLGAEVTKGADGKITITVPQAKAKPGFVEVTATWTEGTGDAKKTVIGKRTIELSAGTSEP